MNRRRLRNGEIREAFERRAAHAPRPGLLTRILRAIRLAPQPTVIAFPGVPVQRSAIERLGVLLAAAPIVAALVVGFVVGRFGPLLPAGGVEGVVSTPVVSPWQDDADEPGDTDVDDDEPDDQDADDGSESDDDDEPSASGP